MSAADKAQWKRAPIARLEAEIAELEDSLNAADEEERRGIAPTTRDEFVLRKSRLDRRKMAAELKLAGHMFQGFLFEGELEHSWKCWGFWCRHAGCAKFRLDI